MLKIASPTKVLTVVVLLSLGKESTQREYKIAFAENETIDENAEAIKVAAAASKKYTSIIHLGGNTSVLSCYLNAGTV
jgi:hypothetical protein